MANFCIVALILPFLIAVSYETFVSNVYTSLFERVCREVPINYTEVGSRNSSSELVCEEQPHQQEINASVLEFKGTNDWRTLRSSLLSLLPKNSAVYRQLETRSTADHLYTWHVGVCGYTQLMSLFLCSGLDVNRQGNYIGNEWLIGASGRGLLNIAKMLLSQGADINTRDLTGFTPLMIAAATGNIDVVKFLVETGANTTLKNLFGEDALQEAQAVNNAEVVKYLEQFSPKKLALSHNSSVKYSWYYPLSVALCILITIVK